MDAMSKWDHLEPSSHQVAAPKRSFSQASLPVAAAAQSASSSKAEASSSSKVNPYELYGVSPPSRRRAMKSQVFAVDSSSQEGNASPVADMEVAPEHENGDTAAVLLQVFDQEKGVVKRQLANGETLEAQCVPSCELEIDTQYDQKEWVDVDGDVATMSAEPPPRSHLTCTSDPLGTF